MGTANRGHLSRDKFYRFLGIRLANEGDGYDDPMSKSRHEIQLAQEQSSEEKPGGKLTRPNPDALGNPGTVAELHRCCHDMLPQTFEGLRLNVSRAVNSRLTLGHALQVGGSQAAQSQSQSQSTDGQLNVSYAGDRQHSLTGEPYPQLLTELDARGNVSGTLLHFLTPRWRAKLTATVVDAELRSSRLFVDYFGDDHSCTCVLSNIDVCQRRGVFVASYLQQVTEQLALGVDFIYQREEIVPGGEAALISAAARYQHANRTWSIMLSLHSLELCYSQIYSPLLGASVQLQANILKRQAISRLCYHCCMPEVGFNFRGGIDSRGVISAVCEKRLEPLPLLLQLSGKLNHLTSRFRFGLGLVVG